MVEATFLEQLAKHGVLGLLLAISLFANYKLVRFIIDTLLGVIDRAATNNERVARALEEAARGDDG